MCETNLKMIIGENLRYFRKARGLTQEQLAELVGREPSAISHLERMDRLMGVELLVKMADALSISTDSLLRPMNTVPHFTSITSLLANQFDDALGHLETIIRAWLSQYGDPKSPSES